MRLGLLLTVCILAGAGAPYAMACTLPVQPALTAPLAPSLSLIELLPEFAEQRLRKQEAEHAALEAAQRATLALQSKLWDAAGLVLVARLEGQIVVRRSGDRFPKAESPAFEFTPVQWLKGVSGDARFALENSDAGSCGPTWNWTMNPSENLFIVFMRGSSISQRAMMDVIKLNSAVEPRLLAALTAQ